jgi:hypothetical protein
MNAGIVVCFFLRTAAENVACTKYFPLCAMIFLWKYFRKFILCDLANAGIFLGKYLVLPAKANYGPDG